MCLYCPFRRYKQRPPDDQTNQLKKLTKNFTFVKGSTANRPDGRGSEGLKNFTSSFLVGSTTILPLSS